MTYVFSLFDVTKPHLLTSKIAAAVPWCPFFVAGYLCHTSTRRRNLLRSRGPASSSAQSAGRRWISCCHPWGLACNVNDEPAQFCEKKRKRSAFQAWKVGDGNWGSWDLESREPELTCRSDSELSASGSGQLPMLPQMRSKSNERFKS